MGPTDPRIVATVDAIATDVSNGGLLSNNLVYRYNVEHTDDGLTGEEGNSSIFNSGDGQYVDSLV